MKALITSLAIVVAFGLLTRAQQESASPADQSNKYSDVPKEYEVGESTVSPDGRFAILYPVRPENSNDASSPPNVLVRLKPYAVLVEDVCPENNGPGWIDSRGAPAAKWGGNEFVAIWQRMKWGPENLVVYEIANDKVKRVEKIWPEVVKYFDRDFHQRFLKEYPKESDDYKFVADDSEMKSFAFKDQKLLLNIFADNKPNLAAGPHWTAELHAVWNLKSGKFDKVDFKPGKISIRKPEDN
jgi:hypothetical protein